MVTGLVWRAETPLERLEERARSLPVSGSVTDWEDTRFQFAQTLEERLLAGACVHSQEVHVALVSPIPPKGAWRQIARRYNRKIIPIPLKRFSGQTIHRLRHFHVLNGHNIRSFAAQFIRE